MKICYLLLCHKNINQINELINALDSKESFFIIHFDKKFYLNQSVDLLINKKNIYLINKYDSTDISWGSCSMIRATLKMIDYAYNNFNPDYFILLSGQDLPIVSKSDILDFLSADKHMNYIDVMKRSDRLYPIFLKRTQLYYFPSMIGKGKFASFLRKLYKLISGGKSHTFSIFKRKWDFEFEFEFGSQWWILTKEAIIWMMDYLRNNPEYIKYFENVYIPDECFFQTLFMASPYKNKKKSNLTYINWKKNMTPSPEIFLYEDLNQLYEIRKSRKFLFARKFDEQVDDNIIKFIINKNERS